MRIPLLILATLLVLAGCSSFFVSSTHPLSADECKILSKKRVVSRPGKQPRLRPNYTMRSETPRSPIRENSNEPIEFTLADNGELPVFYASTNTTIPGPPSNTAPALNRPDAKIEFEPAPSNTVDVEHSSTETFLFAPVETHTEWLTPAMLAGSLICSVALLAGFAPVFMRVSAWAARHPVAARMMIASAHTATATGAFLAGSTLADNGERLPASMLVISGGVAIAGLLAHPGGAFSLGTFTTDYIRRKACEMLLFAGGTAMLFTVANLNAHSSLNVGHHYEYARHTESSEKFVPDDKKSSAVTIKRVKTKDPEPKRRRYIGLKILVIALFSLATLGVAGLSCALACEGYELGAALLLFLGEGAMIFFLIISWRSINRKVGKRAREQKVEPVPVGT